MKMVSAAKLRKAQDAIIQMRPYANELKKDIGQCNIQSRFGMLIINILNRKDVRKDFNHCHVASNQRTYAGVLTQM